MNAAVVIAWLRANIIPVLIGAVVLIAAAWFAVSQWEALTTAKTKEKVATGQADAAVKSGTDAVNTLGNRMQADDRTDALTREIDIAIRTIPGTAAPVPDDAARAARDGLCRYAAYSGDPECVQQADPR